MCGRRAGFKALPRLGKFNKGHGGRDSKLGDLDLVLHHDPN